MCSRNITQGPSVNTNLATSPYPQLQEIEDLLSILLKLLGTRFPSRSTVAPIIPNETIDLFVQKPFQIVGVRVVDHVLVGHGVWITENYSVVVKVLRLVIIIVQLAYVVDEWFLRCREEHGVDFDHVRWLMHLWIIFSAELPDLKIRFQ